MSNPSVVLCIDQLSEQYPEQLGLSGEVMSVQPWLKVFNEGLSARTYLATQSAIEEVWVVSADDVAPINLAAALKADQPNRYVCLLTRQESGSLMSRAKSAGIDASLSVNALAKRYVSRKQRFREQELAAQTLGGDQPTPTSSVSPQTQGVPQTQTLPQAATQTQILPVAKKSSAFVITVVSGSGGTGKSTISLLLAYLACALGKKTALVDADLQFGDLAELAGNPAATRITDVAANPALLARVGGDETTPALLGAPQHIEEAETVAPVVGSVLDRLCNEYEVVVLNTGASWAEYHAQLLERSSKALFLVDQRPTALMSSRRALDLCARCGIAASPFLFVVNRCAKGAPFTSIDVSCALRGISAVEVREGGTAVGELLSAGMVHELLDSQNELCLSLEQLLVDLLPAMDKEQWLQQKYGKGRKRKLSRRRRRKLMSGGA